MTLMHRFFVRSIVSAAVLLVAAGSAQAADDLADMSLEDLMNVTVTSAAKREQNKSDAAAAITVLTQEDIRRSGATSIPEVLRLVPGLQVARIDAHRWAISGRGYNGQFANKMLVLIDGRVVYSPLFGGVYWDVQDTVMHDIDRIEVIRGPGGTLWGANAVNGVINITTKSAKDTHGVHAMGAAGNQEYIGEGRYGGEVGGHTSYRAWGRGFKRDDFTMPDDATYQAHDGWWQWRVGARIDSQLTEDDLVTLQGDFYDGQEEATSYAFPVGPVVEDNDTTYRGGNVLGRWTHEITEKQSLEIQAYWDQTQRDGDTNGETRNTADVQIQHDFVLEGGGTWIFNWGTEYFWTGDDVANGTGTTFDPTKEDFHRASGFAQVQWNYFEDRLQVIGGTKLEWNSFTDFEYQPTGRVLVKPIEGNVLWGSVSRAVRAPTRIDRDIFFDAVIIQVFGNKNIQSEDLLAFEFGYRNLMLDNLTVDVSAFFNQYTDLVALSGTTFDNGGKSKARGVEVEVAWAPIKPLRFVTGYTFLRMKDDFATGSTPIFGANEGSSPEHTWMLRGFWNLPVVPVELDSTVWYYGKLTSRFDPSQLPVVGDPVPAYWRLDARIAWQALDWLGLEFVGQNLIESQHIEWGEGVIALFPGTYVPRSYYGKVTLTF